METWTNGTKKVEIKDDITVASDFEYCPVGKSPNRKALRACGWMKVKTPKIFYSHGQTSPTRFVK